MPRVVSASKCQNFAVASRLEWILTNGIGGYAMGTVAGVNSRMGHGHLVVPTEKQNSKIVLLAAVEAFIQIRGETYGMSTSQYVGAIHPQGYRRLEEFQIGNAAAWTFKVEDCHVKKTLVIHPLANASTVRYQNLGQESITLSLRPLVCHKEFRSQFQGRDSYPESLDFKPNLTFLTDKELTLYLSHQGAERTHSTGWYYRFEQSREIELGIDPAVDLFCPCELKYELAPGEEAILVASDFEGATPQPTPEELSVDTLQESLIRASERFFYHTPERSFIESGHPWNPETGRDTMICIPGLCLAAKKVETAKAILRDYAEHLNQGLIPNRILSEGNQLNYAAADTTLWFANAIYETLLADWDQSFASEAFQWISQIVEWHIKGTLYGIHIDPLDGLLSQGEKGIQLTWMDMKVGGFYATPRHGKPVDINGLWINLLGVAEWLANKLKMPAADFVDARMQALNSFESKFWNPKLHYYLDTVDPDDASFRPNQLIALSLPFGPGENSRVRHLLDKVDSELLTPFGLRTLSESDPHYIPRYEGSVADCDRALHQGSVIPWLLGPYVATIMRFTQDKKRAERALETVVQKLESYGLDGIAEVYDGSAPQRAAGCPWQATSLAEVLRAWQAVH